MAKLVRGQFAKIVVDALAQPNLFTIQAMRTLSNIGAGAGELGQVLTAWERADELLSTGADPGHAWYTTWNKLAMAEEARAGAMESHCAVSASSAALRASEYHRQSEFFLRLINNEQDPRRQSATASLKQSFQRHLQLREIPFEVIDTPISEGYFIPSATPDKSPTVIYPSGYDSYAEEGWAAGGKEGWDRGYNVCLVDGPGQGHIIRRPQNQSYLRPDLIDEHFQGVTDWVRAHSRSLPDSVVLFGRSFSGCLSLYAAGRLTGKLAGLVLDPPQPCNDRLLQGQLAKLDQHAPGLKQALETGDRETFNTLFWQVVGVEASWDNKFYWQSRLGTHGATTPFEFFEIFSGFDAVDRLSGIDCPVWVSDNKSEHVAMPSLPVLLEHMESEVTVCEFTREREGSLGHILAGAQSQFIEEVYTWIAKTLPK